METASFRLYIVIRTDLDSMTPGRAVAQGSHAMSGIYDKIIEWGGSVYMNFMNWLKEGGGFGTAIVLKTSPDQYITDSYDDISVKVKDGLSFIVYDQTYPILDGSFIHLVDIPTCYAVFCPVEEGDELFKEYELY